LTVFVKVTNGGRHTAADWAVMAADDIMPIPPDLNGDQRYDAEGVRYNSLVLMKTGAAQTIQNEQILLGANGAAQLTAPYDPSYASSAFTGAITIKNYATGTVYEDKFSDTGALTTLLLNYLYAIAQSERDWWAAEHP
jgi:hypothetical protein